jgi:hypothetical protein
MRVIAKTDGFHDGHRVRKGEVFEIPESMKPGKWMEAVADKPKAEPQKGKAKGPQTFSEIAKADSKAQAPKGGADDLV